jgi:hypothetical protein
MAFSKIQAQNRLSNDNGVGKIFFKKLLNRKGKKVDWHHDGISNMAFSWEKFKYWILTTIDRKIFLVQEQQNQSSLLLIEFISIVCFFVLLRWGKQEEKKKKKKDDLQ